MSAIDSFEHAHVGNFFDFPIYWVLNESMTNELDHLTDNQADTGKIINQYSLSVGGGSGEHPALIFNNDAVLYHYFLGIEEIDEPSINATETETLDYQMFQLAQKIENRYVDKENKYQNLNNEICYWTIDQNQWPLEAFIHVSEKWAQSKPSNHFSHLAQHIAKAIALFIIQEMPLEQCVQDSELIELAQMYRTQMWDKAFDKKEEQFLQLGIATIKDNQKSGKIIRNNQTVWGYSLQDWFNDNIPLIEKKEFEELMSQQSVGKKIKL